MAHDGPNFLDPKMKNNLIWEGIEFATLKILYEGCKLQKNENIGATVLNCLCITNWMRSVVFPMVCLWYGSCYKKKFKGDVLCVQTSLTQLSSCNISAGYFFLISFHPVHIFLLLSSAMGMPNPKSSFSNHFFWVDVWPGLIIPRHFFLGGTIWVAKGKLGYQPWFIDCLHWYCYWINPSEYRWLMLHPFLINRGLVSSGFEIIYR